MENNKQRLGAQTLNFEQVELFKSQNNKSETIALHFDTEDTNQFCDFTEAVLEIVSKSGIKHGSVNLFTPHTTTAVVINESETGFINDFKKKIEELVPSDSYYEHDDWDLRTENMQEDENVNGRSHVRGTIIGSSGITLPIINSELIIGRWQRLFFVELDCARSRRLFVQTQDLN
jgi:secondary thiamine-phosphate synthase enzyme